VVALVLVSHSRQVAEGVAALAREMGGEVAIEAAGGMEDDPEALGTDAERVRRAIEAVRSPDGVLVLMDLGSALMSAEMGVEFAEGEGPVKLTAAPLVEGAVAAATLARSGASLDEVEAEARRGLRPKAEQLGEEEAPADAAEAPEAEDGEALRARAVLDIPLGLHARPQARLAAVAGRFPARVRVSNATRGRGPADARSLVALSGLQAHHGDELAFAVTGEGAEAALAAVEELAAAHFGDEPGPPRDAPAPPAAPERRPGPAAAPPAAGTRLEGVPAAAGVAIGPARPIATPRLEVPDAPPAGTPEQEAAALETALAGVRKDLAADRASVAERAGEGEAAIFEAHAALLEDPALLDAARAAVRDDGRSAAAAWAAAARDAAEGYRALDDPYLRERAVDVEDVAARVLAHLAGESTSDQAAEGVVVAEELTPGQAAGLDPAAVQGIAGAHGGATSHAAILARALGIPAVVGLGPAVLAVAPGTPLVLDGNAGTVDVDPGDDALAAARERRAADLERRRALRERAAEPGATRDGHRVEVFANLGAPAEAAPAVAQGAEGVGLLRTEFLFLDRADPPDEDEQAEVYGRIAAALGGRPLVLRTLDAGADKPLPFAPQDPEANPFLGVRGLRLGLAQPALLRTQLRAVVRVAAEHPVKVMFPMVATLAEVRAAREALAEAGAPEDLEVGVMVEVPSVALQAERFAREVDFFSVGTNDLTQYAMAAERGNEHLAGLLDGPQPAVLRLIRAVVEGAEAHGRWVGVCGELAGEPDAAVLLAGLGVTELSMAAGRIPEVKAALRAVDLAAAQDAARRALDADDAAAARTLGAAIWR
jgi:multiphosphoryl transfer protein